MLRARLVLPLAWLFSCSTLWAQPAKVLIIRHAEKPEQGHCLSVKGWQRATALVPFFLGELSDECGNPQPGFARPAAIFAQKPTEENKSLRPLQTVQGLAQAMKIELQRYAHTGVAQMVQDIRATPALTGKTILICWEHHAIPKVAQAFGVQDPPEFHGSAFDRVWVINIKDGKAKLRDVPQQLLFGDSSE